VIPPPERICPQCGNPIPLGMGSCSVCGHGRASTGLLALWIVLLVLVGLPAALMGGCFLFLTTLTPSPPGGTRIDPVWTILSLLGVLLPVFFIVMIVRSRKQ